MDLRHPGCAAVRDQLLQWKGLRTQFQNCLECVRVGPADGNGKAEQSMKLRKDSAGNIYGEINVSTDSLDLVDYILVNGIRFGKETEIERGQRRKYEPGGEFHHLTKLSPNDPMNR